VSELQIGIIVFVFVVICSAITLSIDLYGIHKRLRNIENLLTPHTITTSEPISLSPSEQNTDNKKKVSNRNGKNQ